MKIAVNINTRVEVGMTDILQRILLRSQNKKRNQKLVSSNSAELTLVTLQLISGEKCRNQILK